VQVKKIADAAPRTLQGAFFCADEKSENPLGSGSVQRYNVHTVTGDNPRAI
jgi:hypothetical protein